MNGKDVSGSSILIHSAVQFGHIMNLSAGNTQSTSATLELCSRLLHVLSRPAVLTNTTIQTVITYTRPIKPRYIASLQYLETAADKDVRKHIFCLSGG